MNLAFFNQVETHLNPERLDAYRQDGVDEVSTLARLGNLTRSGVSLSAGEE
jgi:hypothetical protein